ncbi:insulin receptor substrate 1 isoform X2 [Onthophagus taurus]|uniref:insulin receptor substrate 1 isoform X2 n=1 Tax=Onthophagus taurus TaxID=166361 RepID=UPI000C2088BE|nr:insulin receptor substrate 1 isoform X2 [Onthophagus taurus]
MSVKSTSSVGDASGVVRTGYLKKLRTSKRKKFFVLRSETVENAARLEYYDSEKKYAAGARPKRAIALKSCFNINRQPDSKHRHVIALYTKDDRFCILFDSDEELDSWLKILLLLQHGDEATDGVAPRPTFEHVWQVNVLKRGLGTNYSGKEAKTAYRLCLTDKILSLVKKDTLDMKIELDLSSIRSCGNLKTYFFMEVGRNSEIGAGELWMETEDQNIAQNIHHTVYHAMISKKDDEDELDPKRRIRSSSATESTKSNNSKRTFLPGKVPSQTAAFAVKVNHQRTRSLPLAQPASEIPPHHQRTAKRHAQSKCYTTTSGRERCDSMPSRSRTKSEGTHNNMCGNIPRGCMQRPHSYYPHLSPSGSPITPPSAAGSTDSTGSSNSVDDCDGWVHEESSHRCGGALPIVIGGYTHSLTPDEPIAEEDNCGDDFFLCDKLCKPRLNSNSEPGYVDMSPGNKHITSPTTSLSSITSGTPSTDYKFNEYNVDKSFPHVLRSEEDDLRPERTKSVGSTDSKMKLARERAFSCGAKTKKFPERFFHPHPSSYSNPKSNSAPLLQSHGDPKSDLMLLDFSSNMAPKNNKNSGYVPMKPGVLPDLNHNHDKRRSQQSSTDSLYANRNRTIIKGHEIRSSTQDYVDMRAGTSPKITNNPQNSSGYMVMDLSKNKKENNSKKYSSPLSRSPISPITTTTTTPSDYMDMNYNKNKNESISPNIFECSPNSIEFIDSEPKSVNEGYVEMTPGKGISNNQHQRQSSIDSETDYANMSFINKPEKKSQPIQIQNQTKSSPNPYHFWQKKQETPPNKSHLNLSINSNYSSLPRKKEPKDSSSSILFPFNLSSPISPTNEGDYTIMDYNPKSSKNSLKDEGDYTLMSTCFRPIVNDSSPKEDKSRPSSSTSTLVASRPASVNSEQLLYASLELKGSSASDDEERNSLKSLAGVGGVGKENNQDLAVQNSTGGFQYAKIDFNVVNHPTMVSNRVKH